MTARGTVFLALEDETGMVNVTLWPAVWAEFRNTIRRHALLLVDGDLQREGNVVNVVARNVRPLVEAAAPHGGAVELVLPAHGEPTDRRGARARALVSSAGRTKGSGDVAPSCASVRECPLTEETVAAGRQLARPRVRGASATAADDHFAPPSRGSAGTRPVRTCRPSRRTQPCRGSAIHPCRRDKPRAPARGARSQTRPGRRGAPLRRRAGESRPAR